MFRRLFTGVVLIGLLAGSSHAFQRRVLLEEFQTEW